MSQTCLLCLSDDGNSLCGDPSRYNNLLTTEHNDVTCPDCRMIHEALLALQGDDNDA